MAKGDGRRASNTRARQAGNGRRTARKSRLVKPAFLSSDELTKLRNYFETWQAQRLSSRHHQLLETMAQDAYTQAVREIRAAHDLPPQYTVDFESGMATPVEETDAEEAASG